MFQFWQPAFEQNFIHGKTLAYSPFHCGSIYSKSFGPSSDGKCFAAAGNSNKAALVPGLFRRSCPHAITWAIVAIAVATLNRVFWRWTPAHVCKELFKRVSPFFADRNPAIPIVVVGLVALIVASANHMAPHSVFGTIGHSVSCGASLCCFANEATATSSCTAFKATHRDQDLNAIVLANAIPEGFTSEISPAPRSNKKPTESFSSEINTPLCVSRWVCGFDRIGDSHNAFLSVEGKLWLEPADVSASVRLASFYRHPLLNEMGCG